MPISEDEYERCSVNEATSTMSKAELRKTHKPIMEKRRRARINHCLNEIKTLILEAMKKDPARHSKLEKADILEMAVKHLQTVQRQQLAIAMAADPTVLRKFKTGFNECADEVTSYIAQIDGPESGLKHNISSHLTKCISGIEQIAQYSFPGLGSVSFMPNNQNLFGASLPDKSEGEPLGDQNNNPRVKIPQGIQLIPSRLPSGEIAFLVPNSRNLQCFSNIRESPGNAVHAKQDFKSAQRPSAFVSVIPNCTTTHCQDGVLKTLSPPLSPTSSSNSQSDDVIIVGEHFHKSPSPARGFRPVNPALHKSYQSAFVSTANVSGPRSYNPEQGAELKSIRYPIHKYSSPKKIAEPLSIITNHSERFKQAQVVEDSARYEENIPHGIKRKYREHQGLLAVATDEFLYPAKVPKTSKDTYAMQQRNFDVLSSEASSDEKDDDSQPSTSANTSTDRGNSGSSGDMWRPW